MKTLWVSSITKGTCLVVVDENNVIVDTAPIWRKFIGRPLKVLVNWLGKDVRVSQLKEN
jgi:hypothetical protein